VETVQVAKVGGGMAVVRAGEEAELGRLLGSGQSISFVSSRLAASAGHRAAPVHLFERAQARVAELERRLGKDSSNSSKPPSSDGLRKPRRVERRAAERAVRRPGKQPGAPGTHLAQVARPDEVVEHVPDRCGKCNADLVDAPVVGVETRQVFDLPRLRLGVVEHRAERRRCASAVVTWVDDAGEQEESFTLNTL